MQFLPFWKILLNFVATKEPSTTLETTQRFLNPLSLSKGKVGGQP